MVFRDAVGTGVFGSEYFVASKGFWSCRCQSGVWAGAALRVNGDIGNPWSDCQIVFRDEPLRFMVLWRRIVSFGDFFWARVGFLEVWTTHSKIGRYDLLVEYNPDQYAILTSARGGELPSSAISYGISWEALPGVTLSLSHQNGDELDFLRNFLWILCPIL